MTQTEEDGPVIRFQHTRADWTKMLTAVIVSVIVNITGNALLLGKYINQIERLVERVDRVEVFDARILENFTDHRIDQARTDQQFKEILKSIEELKTTQVALMREIARRK